MHTKNNKTEKLLFYMMCALIMLSSCKKEDPAPEITYYYLDATLYPYMFETGTYWVYENDSTSATDSVTVTSTKTGFFNVPPSHPGTPSNTEIEYYKINLHSYFNSEDYTDFLFSGLVTRNGSEEYPVNYGQPVLLPQYDIGSGLYGAYVINKIDTLEINGNPFYNVTEMKIIADVFGYDTYLYYQDSIGLIKKVTDMGNGNFESWSLKQWNTNL